MIIEQENKNEENIPMTKYDMLKVINILGIIWRLKLLEADAA